MVTEHIQKTYDEFVKQLEADKQFDLGKFVTTTDGTIKANWKEIATLLPYRDDEHGKVLRYLMIKKILSFGKEGNYLILDEFLNCNPTANSGLPYYFTQQEDAREYAKTHDRGKHATGLAKIVSRI